MCHLKDSVSLLLFFNDHNQDELNDVQKIPYRLGIQEFYYPAVLLLHQVFCLLQFTQPKHSEILHSQGTQGFFWNTSIIFKKCVTQ